MNKRNEQESACKVMVLDDDPELTGLLSDIAEMEGHEVISLNDATQFDEVFNHHIDVLFMDLMMPGRDGIEILRYLAEIKSNVLIVIVSGFDSGVLEVASELGKEHDLNIHATLIKPFRVESVRQILKESIAQSYKRFDVFKKSKRLEQTISVSMVKEALERGDFCFFYQPQVSLHDDHIVGYEALARWPHPEMGMIPPAGFIPFVEAKGLISELSLHLIQTGFKEFSRLKNNNCLTMSINLSTDELTNLDLPDILSGLALSNGLKREQIIIEVTESGVIRDIRVSLDILARFRLMGFKLSIDDFGTGSAMYEYLQRLPLNELKIDQSFVAKVLTDTKAKTIVEHTASLARELNLRTVAEGVETKEIARFLKNANIDFAQGYLYSKPLSFMDLINVEH